MRRFAFALLLPLVLVSSAVDAAAFTPAAVAVQTPPTPAPPDKRPEVEKILEEFKSLTEKKGIADREAVEVIDTKIIPEFKHSGPKDRQAIVNALAKSFDLKRNEEKEGVPNTSLYIACSAALAEMAPESSKALMAAVDNKNLKKLMAVRQHLVKSLGKTKDTKEGLDFLVNLLQDKEATIVAAAAEALGNYGDVDQVLRKKAFEALLKIVNAAKDNKDANPTDGIARDRYDAIASAIVTSLGKLSKYDERDPDKWRTWWNKNKGKNWDE